MASGARADPAGGVAPTDGGGATESVEDGSEGFVVAPEPQTLAAALDRIYEDKQKARSMGERGREKLLAMNITWQHVVDKIISSAN